MTFRVSSGMLGKPNEISDNLLIESTYTSMNFSNFYKEQRNVGKKKSSIYEFFPIIVLL